MIDSASAREILERLVKQSGITKKLAAEILHIIPDIVEEGLKKDGEVRVKGLGTFRLKQVRSRVGRNPKTGERVEIPPHNRVVFLPEQSFKEYINRDYRLLSYKIIQPAEKAPSVDEIIPESETLPQYVSGPEPETLQPSQPEPQPKPGPQNEPEPGNEPPSGKRRVHWILPIAITVIIILSLIFYFRNCYHSSQQPEPEVGSQQSEIDNQRPVPTAEPEEKASENLAKLKTQNSQLRTVTEGQYLFGLAREIYGNPYLWVLIYRENQDKITDPDILISGKELVIPALEGTPDHLTRNDSVAVSESYRMLYEYFSTKEDIRKDDFLRAMERYKPM